MALPTAPSRARPRFKSPAAEPRPLDSLREQLARESLTYSEYERSSRRTLEALAAQVASLRGSFEALAGSVHAELDRGRLLVSDRLSLLGEWQGNFEKGLQDRVATAVAEELGRRLPDVERSVAGSLQETTRRLLKDGEAGLRAGLLAEADAAADARVQAAAGKLEGRLDQELRALDRRQGELEQSTLREARQASELSKLSAQQGDRLLHKAEEETAAALREISHARRAHEGRLEELGRQTEDASRQVASLGEVAAAQREASARLREQLGAVASETSLLGDALGAERAEAAALEERLEAHLGAVEAQLRAELQERHLRLQRSVSRQLDGMSRAMTVGGCEDSWRVMTAGGCEDSWRASLQLNQ